MQAKSQNALCRMQSMDVVWASFDSHQDHLLSVLRASHRLVGRENHLAGSRPWRGWQALGNDGLLGLGVQLFRLLG